jgi:hypothetical protein
MSQNCPPISDLLDAEPAAIDHARGCERCRALLALAEPIDADGPAPRSPVFARANLPERHPLAARTVGEVVSLRSGRADGELLLAALLAISEESIEVAPLSGDVGLAAEWDLLLDATQDPLGYEAIAEVWNHGRVLPGQVAESLGVLSERTGEELLRLYAAVFADEPPADARTGPPLLSEEDPRSSFQDREVERTRRYWSDAEDLGAGVREGTAEGIGVLVGAWLEEVGDDAAGLATQVGWMQGDVERLLREEINRTQTAFAPQRMAELLAYTTIEADDARVHLQATLVGTGPAAPTAAPRAFLARPVYHRAPASVEKRLQAKKGEGPGEIEAYVTEVIAALEELRD